MSKRLFVLHDYDFKFDDEHFPYLGIYTWCRVRDIVGTEDFRVVRYTYLGNPQQKDFAVARLEQKEQDDAVNGLITEEINYDNDKCNE